MCLVLVQSDGALEGEQQAQQRERAAHAHIGTAHAREPPDCERGHAEGERDLAVAVDDEVHRGAAVEVQAVDALPR